MHLDMPCFFNCLTNRITTITQPKTGITVCTRYCLYSIQGNTFVMIIGSPAKVKALNCPLPVRVGDLNVVKS